MRETKTIVIAVVVFSLLLSLTALAVHKKIRDNTIEEIERTLVMVKDTTTLALKTWFKDQKVAARVWANSPQIRELTLQLLALPPQQATLLDSDAQMELRDWFQRLQKATRYQGYFVIGPGNINLASSRDQNIAVENLLVAQQGFLDGVWAGKPAVSLPIRSDVPLPDSQGRLVPDLATMLVAAPIFDNAGETIAIFMFRLRPEEGFTYILKQGRIGNTGETYAVDRQGHLISPSRFDSQLQDIGLIPSGERAILNIQLFDPGVNLVDGEQSDIPRDQQPLTHMAASVINGESGTNLRGYRDYRGVPVVGAWHWDQELGLGLTTEQDVEEAYQTLRATQLTIVMASLLIFLLSLGLAIIYAVYRQRRTAEQALRESESRFRVLVEGIGKDYLIYRRDFDGAYTYVTPAFEDFTGLPIEKALGRKWWEFFSVTSDTRERLDNNAKALEQSVFVAPYEGSYFHPDKTLRLVEVSERPEFDENGKPVAFMGIVRDITERKKVEQELQRAATVFENTDEGIIVTNANGDIVLVNKAFTTISGYESDEVIGKNPRTQQSGLHDAAFYQELWRTLKEKRSMARRDLESA